MSIKDYFGLLKKSELTVSSIENPFGDYYLVHLSKPKQLKWTAGEHGLFYIPSLAKENMRPLSLASISDENEILIGTRVGQEPSDYKKALMSFKPGDKMVLRGPFGSFKFPNTTSPIVLFASGVGITPMRALLKNVKSKTQQPIHLVHVAQDFHLFYEEFEEIANIYQNISLHKFDNANEAQEKLKELSRQYGNEAYYFNSGAPKVVLSIEDLLMNQGVSKKHLYHDSFNGL